MTKMVSPEKDSIQFGVVKVTKSGDRCREAIEVEKTRMGVRVVTYEARVKLVHGVVEYYSKNGEGRAIIQSISSGAFKEVI